MRLTNGRRMAGLAAVAAIAAISLAACSSNPSDDPSEGPTGNGGDVVVKDVLTLGMTVEPYGWDPRNQPGYQNWNAEAVWDRLVKCDENSNLEPDIAESWEILPDNMGITATLREGLTFSDGTPVDAEAVKANFEYVAAPESARAADFAGLTYDIPDPLTITITWPEPQALINDRACTPYIAQPEGLDSGAYDVPVGSGPYVLDTANTTTGSVYTFTKNEEHWNADGYPYASLVVKYMQSDTAVVSALKTDQLDGGLVPLTSVAEVEASGLDVLSFKGQVTRLLLTDHLGESIPAIGDVRVRQAINMVFDKDLMAQQLYMGVGTPAAQVFREGSDAYIEGLEDPYPFDVEAAKALMAEAGYDEGFSLQLPTMEGQNFETIMPYVKQQLAEINISVEEVPLSGANAISDLLSGDYPVVLWQLGNIGDSTLQIYIESYPDGWWNLMHQPDEYVDSRYAQLATATADEAKVLEQEINQYIIDQAWQAPMVAHGSNFAFNADKVSIPETSDVEALTPKLRDFK